MPFTYSIAGDRINISLQKNDATSNWFVDLAHIGEDVPSTFHFVSASEMSLADMKSHTGAISRLKLKLDSPSSLVMSMINSIIPPGELMGVLSQIGFKVVQS